MEKKVPEGAAHCSKNTSSYSVDRRWPFAAFIAVCLSPGFFHVWFWFSHCGGLMSRWSFYFAHFSNIQKSSYKPAWQVLRCRSFRVLLLYRRHAILPQSLLQKGIQSECLNWRCSRTCARLKRGKKKTDTPEMHQAESLFFTACLNTLSESSGSQKKKKKN